MVDNCCDIERFVYDLDFLESVAHDLLKRSGVTHVSQQHLADNAKLEESAEESIKQDFLAGLAKIREMLKSAKHSNTNDSHSELIDFLCELRFKMNREWDENKKHADAIATVTGLVAQGVWSNNSVSQFVVRVVVDVVLRARAERRFDRLRKFLG